MAELFLDPCIRSWVFLPLVIITFLFGVLRHYMTIMFTSEKKGELENIGDSHALIRSRLLRENGRFLPNMDFLKRKSEKVQCVIQWLVRLIFLTKVSTDPSMATEMLRSNALNMVPMIVIGSWINWAFSGFLTTKVPFPLTYRFKPMLQRGCESLTSLDASWVSSASWYFLNIFGLRSMYGLVLGSDNAADHSMVLSDPQVPAPQGPQDMQKAFKTEWEALEVVDHQWALADCETRLLNKQ
ncbi:hypothetical protein MN116_005157 [Schistosoma mekongi]|uniref:ER membrane protein complex subunit 3 n=1 Tax=Schistosoma mekongi TaxID=38744 RepID=A0AAE2D522_SCHME|nr:hypothetical protein MN116_005157 [Schistosoma mekongi]